MSRSADQYGPGSGTGPPTIWPYSVAISRPSRSRANPLIGSGWGAASTRASRLPGNVAQPPKNPHVSLPFLRFP